MQEAGMAKLMAARDGNPKSETPLGATYLYWGEEPPTWDERRMMFVLTARCMRMGEIPIQYELDLKPGEWKEVDTITFKEKETA